MDSASQTKTGPGVEPEVQMYICRFLSRLLARHAPKTTQAETAPIISSRAPCPEPETVGVTCNDDVVVVFERRSECDSMYCNEEQESRHEDERAAVDTSGADNGVTEAEVAVTAGLTEPQVEETIGTRASAFKQKAADVAQAQVCALQEKTRSTYTALDASAKTLKESVNHHTIALADKTKANYSVLDSTAMKYSKQLEETTNALGEKTAPIMEKTKAAAEIARTRSGELASTAYTRSGQLASSTKDKLQAAQGGLRSIVKNFAFGRGGA